MKFNDKICILSIDLSHIRTIHHQPFKANNTNQNMAGDLLCIAISTILKHFKISRHW